jgi:SRSO17 transposase
VVVSAEYVADEPRSSAPLHWPLTSRLYLPEGGWAANPERRKRAHVPEEVEFRSKPQIALSLVEEARRWGVPFEVVVADCGYGDNPNFLRGLEEREISYVCGVESELGVRYPEEVVSAKEAGAPPYKGKGQPPKEQRPAPLYMAREVIESVPEQAWREVSWREGSKGTLSKRVAAVRVHRGTGSERHSVEHERVETGAEGWLIGERPLPGHAGGECKYYFSTLSQGSSLKRLTELAHSRWAIERFYEDSKGECGLGDFQGRRWDGFHRHLALSMVAYSFLMLESSVAYGGGTSREKEVFSPLGGDQADDASGDPPAGSGVAAGGSGFMVHRDRPDKELPSSSNLTK